MEHVVPRVCRLAQGSQGLEKLESHAEGECKKRAEYTFQAQMERSIGDAKFERKLSPKKEVRSLDWGSVLNPTL